MRRRIRHVFKKRCRAGIAFILTMYLLAFGPMTAWAAPGDLLWAQSADIGYGNDSNQSIGVDSNGNTYVVGQTSSYTLQTIKYSSTGVLQWVRTYGTSVSSAGAALVVDTANNIYVTGGTNLLTPTGDLITIKYDANGNQLWAKSYTGGGTGDDIAVDSRGNIIVAGDYAVVKYTASGKEKWGQSSVSRGRLVDIDAQDDIYISGWNGVTSKYNTNGNLIWTQSSGVWVRDLAVNSSGVYVTGGGGNDCITIKYNAANGTQEWSNNYNYGSQSNGEDVAIDGQGNIYVTGFSFDPSNNNESDILLIKYDSAGTELWVRRYNNGDEYGYDIAFDANNNVYVAGEGGLRSPSLPTDYNIQTVKYDSNGTLIWAREYVGPSGGYDGFPVSMTADINGIYVNGRSDTGIATLKYAP